MRTVTLELATADLTALGVIPARFFDRYEEVELLETLRLERGSRLQLLRLRRRGALRTAAELERESRRIRRLYGLAGFELVERRPRTRDYLLFVRQRNPPGLRALIDVAGGDIVPTAPFRLGPERTIATFRAEERALRRVLERLGRMGLTYRVLRTSRRPSFDEPGGGELTPRQREVLARAWTLGHYAIPRRITLARLARLTGQSPPALGKMLRRAERTLVGRYLAAEPPGPPGTAAEPEG